MARERRVKDVPWPALLLLCAGLALQGIWQAARPAPKIHARALPHPPSLALLRLGSFGDEPLLARLMMLYLQAFDNQPGISIPLRTLDYGIVIEWLSMVLELDVRGQYPLLAASRLYAVVPAPRKQRRMLEFVATAFERDPERRWRWLAHAVFVAKHHLHDLPLALRFARQLESVTTAPHWARQMHIFVVEEMGDVQGAQVLLGALLDSGVVTDPNERWFLGERLRDLEAAASAADGAPK